jgi:hypothetical protein
VLLWATRCFTNHCEGREEKRYKKTNQIHLCLDTMREQRDRGSGARTTENCICNQNHQILIGFIIYHPHGVRDIGKIHFSDILCSIKKSATSPSVYVTTSRYDQTSVVLVLFSRPSCFLDWVPCRHHQVQFWSSNVHLCDLSMPSFSGSALSSAGFVVPANQVPYFLRIGPDAREHGDWHHLRIP